MISKKRYLILAIAVIGAVTVYFYPGATTPVTTPAMAQEESAGKQLYTCGMHPTVILDHPGICPICEMKLTPMQQDKSQGSSTITIDPVTTQNMGVRTAAVERMDLSRAIRTNGEVKIDESKLTIVNPKISGWIEILYVDETGQKVSRGQPLLKLYSPNLVAAQEEYLLALKTMRTAEDSGIESMMKSSKAMLDAARDRLLNFDMTSSQIEQLADLDTAPRLVTIYAPADGIVLHKNAVQGARVAAGTDLFRIADLSAVWVEAEVYEYELPWVSEGQQAMITTTYEDDVKYSATVDYIYPYLSKKNRAARIRLEVGNPTGALKPDMYVTVSIHARTIDDAVAIPREAVIRSGKRDIVFVPMGEGKFEPREVDLGLEADNGMFAVTNGLSAGERVVTSAQFLLDSELQLKEALNKLLSGGGDEADLHAAMGHSHGGESGDDADMNGGMPEASGRTMEALYESDELYQCPEHDQIITAEAGTICPLGGKELEAMSLDEIKSLRTSDPHGCVMCPIIHPGSEKDERCAICNMKLKPVPRES